MKLILDYYNKQYTFFVSVDEHWNINLAQFNILYDEFNIDPEIRLQNFVYSLKYTPSVYQYYKSLKIYQMITWNELCIAFKTRYESDTK